MNAVYSFLMEKFNVVVFVSINELKETGILDGVAAAVASTLVGEMSACYIAKIRQ